MQHFNAEWGKQVKKHGAGHNCRGHQATNLVKTAASVAEMTASHLRD